MLKDQHQVEFHKSRRTNESEYQTDYDEDAVLSDLDLSNPNSEHSEHTEEEEDETADTDDTDDEMEIRTSTMILQKGF
ncbi:hypothetical protein cypCar_00003208 [Cyprinus carpio]|nr:hypothetical protein cypCar_00003208 [Cyprinus carpio]